MGSHILRLIGRHSSQDEQGSKWGRILRGAAPDVQGLLQADGHQQGWPAGQERLARRLRCQEEEEEEEEGRQVNYQLSLYFSAKTLADPDKPASFEDSTFQTRYGQYGGGNHPNNIVAWYLTSTNISFIMNSQFTNKDILLWGMELINTRSSEKKNIKSRRISFV